MTDPNTQDIFFMRRAIELAKLAALRDEVPVGAVVVINDEVIAEGFNSPIANSDPTAHAEIIALRKSAGETGNYRLIDATLYVTLEPCIMCVGAMLHARIKRLVFGAFDPKTGAVSSIFRILEKESLNHKIQVCGGVVSEDCSKLLKDFFVSRR